MARVRCGVLLLGLAWLAAAEATAREWYVAPDGVDGGAGTVEAPLATLAHAVGRASAGDAVLLERGGTFRALDLDLGGGLQLDAWGNGDRPILTGSTRVVMTGTWGANPAVRTAAVAQRVVACWVDGRFVRLARWPNHPAFLRNDADDQYHRIDDAELADRPGVAPGRWTGAQVRWRKWSWWWETRPILLHSPVTTLILDPDVGDVGIDLSDPGSGYFIDHDLDELDAPGEWHWQGGVLYVYPPAGADPATMEVDVVTTTSTAPLVDHDDEPEGLRTTGTSLRNLHLSRYYGTALQLNGPATVEDCSFSEIESNAVHYTWNAQPFTIRRSVFRDVRNIAVRGWANAAGPAGSLIERNLFLRIGAEPGYGGNGPWHAAGVIVGQAHAAVVRLNRFVDTGYAGVILGSDGQTVERNLFVRTMGTLNDGAAVYTNCNASTIRDNIILDTLGDLEWSHPWWPLGHGIWPEFLDDFHDSVITGNTIAGSNGHGIFLPNNFDCTIGSNVALDNRRAALGLYVDADPDQGHGITGNVLVSTRPSRRIVRPENLSPWWLPPYAEPDPVALEYDAPADYGTMSDTTFVAPTSVAGVIRNRSSGVLFTTLGEWVADAPSWASATGSLIVRANAILLFNDTEAAAAVTVPAGSWTLPDGSPVGATVSLDPFRSAVLVTADAVPSTPPYVAASGIDWRAAEPDASYLGDTGVIFADGFESGTTGAWAVP